MIDLRALDEHRVGAVETAMSRGLPFPPEFCGCFLISGPTGVLKVIASAGGGWDHVSISVLEQNRCPTWNEMDLIYAMFFKPGETAMQLHVPDEDHVNHHPYTLHLWRPLSKLRPIPRPPSIMVGPDAAKGRKR
jgi:hypothetical protein